MPGRIGTISSGGSSVFGRRPGTLTPPNPMAQLAAAVPQYGAITDLLSENLLAGLQGMIPQDVSRAVIDAANARSVAGGVGGSGFAGGIGLRDLGLTSKGIQDQAFAQALGLFPVASRTATLDPALLSQIREFNLLAQAAPDPAARGNFDLNLFNEYLDRALAPQGAGAGLALPPFGATSPGVSYSNLAGDSPGFQFPLGALRPSVSPYETQENASRMRLNPAYSTSVYSGTGGSQGWWNQPTPSSSTSLTPSFNPYAGPVQGTYVGPTGVSSPINVPTPPSYGRQFGPLNFDLPSNFGDLTGRDQADYVDLLLQNSGVDSSLYE